MNFDRLHHSTARTQLRLLGGVAGTFEKGGVVTDPILVLVERNVQMPADNGLTLERRNIATLLKQEVGEVKAGNLITVDAETLKVSDLMSDDGFVVKVFVRVVSPGNSN